MYLNKASSPNAYKYGVHVQCEFNIDSQFTTKYHSFLIDINVSHLNFASCYARDIYSSRHFNFATIFKSHKIVS